ncbi:MAG: DUF5753 domain-containing protein [Pseudonocardiaceae bacterium]
MIDFEAKATRIHNYEAMFVPSLLQTAEYARAIIQGIAPRLRNRVEQLMAARMARQALLTRGSVPQFFAVVDEATLRRPVGQPGVMRRQLTHRSALQTNLT